MTRSVGGSNRWWRVAVLRVAAVLATILLFAIDTFVPADVAVSSLYALVLLAVVRAWRPASGTVILAWGLACGMLTILAYAIYHGRGGGAIGGINAAVGLAVIAMTTLRLRRAHDADVRIASGDERYRRVFDILAIAIWEHDFTPVAAAIARLRDEGVIDLRDHIATHPEFVVAARRMVRITDVNATALVMMGVQSKQDFFARLSDFLPETDESFAECIIAIDERWPLFQVETHVLARSGERVEILVTFSLGPDADLRQVPGSIVDIGRRKRAEAEVVDMRDALATVERSSSVAAMSAAIAHEINQPLSAIQSYANAAQRWIDRPVPDMAEATLALEGLGRAVGYARDVVRRVRGLVGATPFDRHPVELAVLLSDTVKLLRRDLAGHNVRIRIDAASAIVVGGDRILLKQVFVNLVTNAIQAMTDTDASDRLIDIAATVDDGHVRIAFADRGGGLDKAVKANAFRNFYTTKPTGMGLGLSICRMIVERHAGTILLADRDGGGTMVTVTLPATVTAASPTR